MSYAPHKANKIEIEKINKKKTTARCGYIKVR